MTIETSPESDFLFGKNIHFVLNMQSGAVIYWHPDFRWVTSLADFHSLREVLLAVVDDKENSQLETKFGDLLQEKFQGMLKVKLSTATGERFLQVVPFTSVADQEATVMGNIIDITDLVVNSDSLAKYAHKKNSILHMLAHDLRGPLNIAKSVLKVVERQINQPELQHKTKYITKILQQSVDMITDLVSREFLETAEVVLVKKRVDIVKKLKEYIEECQRSEDITDRVFSLTHSSEEIYIKLDESKFMQIINNLIANALKFTENGGNIVIDVTESADMVLFSVSDDGIGIPSSQLNEIFEKFTAARRPGLNGEPTVGLGLSIVKTIVGWHSGKIWCESEEGKGTTIHFELPL